MRALHLCALLALLPPACAATPRPAPSSAPRAVERTRRYAETGFLVAAPDRGFWGNEEVRDLVAELALGRNARLVFVTGDLRRADLDEPIAELTRAGATRVVVLPLFLHGSHPRLMALRALVDGWQSASQAGRPVPLTLGRPFGESYLAVELLADRLRAIPDPKGRRLVVVGDPGRDPSARATIAAELERLAARAAEGFGFEAVRAVLWDEHAREGAEEREAEAVLSRALAGGARPVVVPFHQGRKLDSMMSFDAALAGALPKDALLVKEEPTPHPAVGLWLQREVNRHLPLSEEEVGVVFLAHGSNYRWNETMRRAAGASAKRHKLEFAFCMADPPMVERAVRRLEARGVRGIVIVRVFGLASSFQATVERMIGLDLEGEPAQSPGPGQHAGGHGATMNHGHGAMDHGHGHGAAAAAGPPPRIRSAALLTTVGGLEDSPRFAAALLDRALALSKDPSRETVVLTAHGAGDDAANDHWKQLLASLAARMRAGQGVRFRAIEGGTWREDWPGKREPEVAALRAKVEAASRDGRAIVIPARTTAEGPERELLAGLSFALGSGFAPHPEFERWLEEQIALGVARLSTRH